MAYLLRDETAQWLDHQIRGRNVVGHRRRGWIFGDSGGLGDVALCYITGGDALTGYNAMAYESMAELREDVSRTGGVPVVVYPCEIGLDSSLPDGTVVVCHYILCRVTGGAENAEPEQEE